MDATYSLNWQGYPLIVIGNTDANRAFYPLIFALTSSESTIDYAFVFKAIQSVVLKICNKDFVPKVLIADGADAINNAFYQSYASAEQNVMCWFHVTKNIRKYKYLFNSPTNFSSMKKDIDKVQLSRNRETFQTAVQLFLNKWRTSERCFCDYFTKVWVRQKPNWYEGVLQRTPSTNNALERFNRTIKDNYTFREKYPLSK